jgi:serine/threonine-protein kinase
VAIKLMSSGHTNPEQTYQRFRREAEATARLAHPNTVRVFDFGSTDTGLLFLAMELLEGEPLTDCLSREGPLPLTQALTIIQQVLRSIGEAHARGIVHRDLKPDNIYLARVPGEPAPIVKVLDFGIAKAVIGERKIDQFETLDGTVFGTPRYMSPEQAGGRALDPRSDLYSVGIMLYELIAGHPPFVDNDAVVVMARHIRDKPVPLSRATPSRAIPASLDAVLSRALAKTPTERFQNAEEFERALLQCRREITERAGSRWAGWKAKRKHLIWAAGTVLALAAAGFALREAQRTSTTRNALSHVPATAAPESPSEPMAAQRAAGPTHAVPLTQAADGQRSVVSVQSAPPAAAVLQDGSELGVTPLEVSMNKGSKLNLLLKKKGFAEHRLLLRAEDGSRVVTLRRLPDGDKTRDRERPSWRRARERDRSRAATSEPSAPTAVNPTPEPNTPSTEKSSPYERF